MDSSGIWHLEVGGIYAVKSGDLETEWKSVRIVGLGVSCFAFILELRFFFLTCALEVSTLTSRVRSNKMRLITNTSLAQEK